MKKKLVSVLLCLTMVSMLATACEGGSSEESASEEEETVSEVEIKNEGDPVVLATMTDEESQIYGELMKQILEANGYEVDASGVGTYNNSTLPRQSLMENQVDIVQDYTGRGMMFIEDVDPVLYQTDLETAFNTTKEEYDKGVGLMPIVDRDLTWCDVLYICAEEVCASPRPVKSQSAETSIFVQMSARNCASGVRWSLSYLLSVFWVIPNF